MAKELWILKRDGKQITIGTEDDCYTYVHRNHSFSMAHAVQYEGYSLELVGPCCCGATQAGSYYNSIHHEKNRCLVDQKETSR